jgi:hypothetical protein
MIPCVLWAVYYCPPGFPAHYVVRRCVREGSALQFEGDCRAYVALEDAREALLLLGLACVPRQAEDDPTLVECWI